MKLRKILAIATITVLSAFSASAIKTMDVPPYIDQLEERLESFAKAQPSPEIVEAFVQELQATCKTNRTIDMPMMQNMSSCMENLFNQTNLVAEFQEAIPKGDLDVVFRNICLKWPDLKSCIQEGFEVIAECWGQNTESQLMRGMDTLIGFFCGEENDGARIACTGSDCT